MDGSEIFGFNLFEQHYYKVCLLVLLLLVQLSLINTFGCTLGFKELCSKASKDIYVVLYLCKIKYFCPSFLSVLVLQVI